MDIELKNDTFSFKVAFRDSCVIIQSTTIFDEVPPEADKHPVIVTLRPDGRWDIKMEMCIPTGIIYDALNIKDERVLSELSEWLRKMKEDIWITRHTRKKE